MWKPRDFNYVPDYINDESDSTHPDNQAPYLKPALYFHKHTCTYINYTSLEPIVINYLDI